MATQTTRTPPSSANPSAQPSSRPRDWTKLRNGEPGSAFVGLRGRGARGGPRGGRGGHPSGSPTVRNGKLPHPEPSENHGSQSDISTPKAKAPPVRKGSNQSVASSTTSDKPPANSANRASQPKTPSRRASRSVPVVTVAPASPTTDSMQNSPLTPTRNSNRRRRPLQHPKPPSNGTSKPNMPSSTSSLPQKPKTGPASSSIVPHKDVPPHLAAAHEAEIRHGIDALVERVRAVAMAEIRPSTPGSHIDWAGDEDDSLPDLNDWGVTTTNTTTCDGDEEISPILADALRPLPEPQTEEDAEEEQDKEDVDNDDDGETNQVSSAPSPLSDAPIVQDASITTSIDAHENSTAADACETAQVENPSLSSFAKPVVITETHSASSIPVLVGEEPLATKNEGLPQSIHAPLQAETLERTLSSTSSDHGLAASIHAPKGIPESHSAPLLSSPGAPSSTRTFNPSHGRSKTEGRNGFLHPRSAPTAVGQRAARSGTSSPLGPHAHMHGRNHSTPPTGGSGQRAPQSTRPVITGEAMSRLARTIGGMPVIPRAQSVAATKE